MLYSGSVELPTTSFVRNQLDYCILVCVMNFPSCRCSVFPPATGQPDARCLLGLRSCRCRVLPVASRATDRWCVQWTCRTAGAQSSFHEAAGAKPCCNQLDSLRPGVCSGLAELQAFHLSSSHRGSLPREA